MPHSGAPELMVKYQLPESARVEQPARPTFEVKTGERPVGRSRIYPFSKMKVGQYFDVPQEMARTVRAAAWQFARRYGFKFYSSSLTENGVSLVRIWRVR